MNDTATLRRALSGYVSDSDSMWHSPHSDISYAVNSSLSLRSLKNYKNSDNVVAIWDPRFFKRKYYLAAFLDGHAKPVKEADWAQIRSASGVVKNVLAPPYPTAWSLDDREDIMPLVLPALSLGALTAAFLAAWREAYWLAQTRVRHFFLNFVGWFTVRFFGYGFCMVLAASGTVFVVYLLLPVV